MLSISFWHICVLIWATSDKFGKFLSQFLLPGTFLCDSRRVINCPDLSFADGFDFPVILTLEQWVRLAGLPIPTPGHVPPTSHTLPYQHLADKDKDNDKDNDKDRCKHKHKQPAICHQPATLYPINTLLTKTKTKTKTKTLHLSASLHCDNGN